MMETEKIESSEKDPMVPVEPVAEECLEKSGSPEKGVVLMESVVSESSGDLEHLENSSVAENAVNDKHEDTVTDITNVTNGGMERDHEFKEADIHNILKVIAATGKFWHEWEILKRMLSCHLKKVLSEYPEAQKTSEQQITSLGETVPALLKRLDDALKSFIEGPPFTLQRLSEILLVARDIYPNLSKLALALEKGAEPTQITTKRVDSLLRFFQRNMYNTSLSNLSVTSTLTICTDQYPPAEEVQKPKIADEKIKDPEPQTSLVENGVKPPTGDGDEIMAEVEDADVDDHMTIDIETFEEIVRSSEPNPEPKCES